MDLHYGNPDDPELLVGYLKDALHYVSIEPINDHSGDISVGKYVAVRLPKGKKGYEIYPALVLGIQSRDEILLKYMKKSGHLYIFPEDDEIYVEERKSIVQVIDTPRMINDRQQYKFIYNFR
jgi:hypothetical protein